MSPLDWGIVAAYALLTLVIGVWAQRRGAGEDTSNYFLSGRTLPWWLAGASMAASAFSIDTPIYVASLTRARGVAANWEWWFMGASGVLAATVMSRIWRRARVLTDLELMTIRYSGRAAHALRGFRALFFALLLNTLAMTAVIAATVKFIGAALPDLVDPAGAPTTSGWLLVGGFVAVTVAYSVLSGFMGVVITDLFQFVVSMVGAVWLAVVTVGRAGGLSRLAADPGVAARSAQLPDPTSDLAWGSPWTGFLVFMGLLWWSYVNADGGGKYIQRLSSCRDEREAVRASWFAWITFLALRTWPWVLVGLAAVVLWPELPPERVYPHAVMQLEAGARGLVFASLVAAFMSTIDTQLNWGASYVVNDLVRPYLLPGRSERFYVQVGRLYALPALGLVALFLWLGLRRAPDARDALSVTQFLRGVLEVSSGLGAVYLLRWFWWRLTAWGEIAAMVAAPATALGCKSAAWGFDRTALAVTGVTLATAAVTSLLGPREDRDHLRAFAARVHPPGDWRGLRPEGAAAREQGGRHALATGVRFVAGCALLYGLTFAIGALLLVRSGAEFALWVGLTAAGGLGLWLVPGGGAEAAEM